MGLNERKSATYDNHLLGIYRGYVVDVADPEQRGRVRVRVPHVHGNVPVAALPWAEVSSLDGGSSGYGLFIPFKAESVVNTNDGDRVFVLFEGGDADMPVVIGRYASIPDGKTDLPPECRLPSPQDGHRRRRVWKTPHGNRIEISDERGNAEIKIVTGRGDVLQLREASGGRGFHVKTQEGSVFSMQDEEAGDPQAPTLTEYDKQPDRSFSGAFDGNARNIAFPDAPQANGIVQSLTPDVAEGFGQQGVLLKSKAGHRIEFRDKQSQGVSMKTIAGAFVELSDMEGVIRIQSSNGSQVITLSDNGSIQLDSSSSITMTVGSSSIQITASGITITGPSIDMNTV